MITNHEKLPINSLIRNRWRCEFYDDFELQLVMFMTMLIVLFQDSELQRKIEREIKMRDGIAKLLAASKHPAQLMEAAKNMLISNTRVLGYMSELQRRKSEEILKKDE